MMSACTWPGNNPIMRQYHDTEWCVPSYDDRYLFEMLTLEGAQAGLSWETVLSKRGEYQKAFHDFDIAWCAGLSDEEIERSKERYHVIRNTAKLKSVRSNAAAILKIQEEFGSFSHYLWSFVAGQPEIHHWESEREAPAQTALSERISRELKKRNFKFVGPVIVYSFLQAMGMVDDHVRMCPFHTDNRQSGMSV